MSQVNTCDGCRAQIPRGPGSHIHLASACTGEVPEMLDFCGWPCLAEYATARVMIDGVTGEAGP